VTAFQDPPSVEVREGMLEGIISIHQERRAILLTREQAVRLYLDLEAVLGLNEKGSM
jgi:hypothetical protein